MASEANMAMMKKPYEATARRDYRPTAFKLSRHNVGRYNQAIKKKKKDKTSEPSEVLPHECNDVIPAKITASPHSYIPKENSM